MFPPHRFMLPPIQRLHTPITVTAPITTGLIMAGIMAGTMATRSSALDSATGAMDITGVTVVAMEVTDAATVTVAVAAMEVTTAVAAMEVTTAVAEGVTAIADFCCSESKRSENVFLVS